MKESSHIERFLLIPYLALVVMTKTVCFNLCHSRSRTVEPRKYVWPY